MSREIEDFVTGGSLDTNMTTRPVGPMNDKSMDAGLGLLVFVS